MSAIGGSVESITINGRTYAVTADSDYSIKLGGVMNEVRANGNGTARTIKTIEPWSAEGGSVEIDNIRGDAEELQSIANLKTDVAITINMADGSVYAGVGTITGDATISTQSASKQLNLGGPGQLRKQ